jgi:hypothetical protein
MSRSFLSILTSKSSFSSRKFFNHLFWFPSLLLLIVLRRCSFIEQVRFEFLTNLCVCYQPVLCSPIIHLQHATERRDNSEAGSVSVFPVRIHTNLKAETLDDFERKKKGLHISAFRFRIEELRNDLRRTACDSSRAKEEGLKDGGLDKFIESIIDKVCILR